MLLSHTYRLNSPFPTVTNPEQDDDVKLHRSPVVRAVLLVLGSLALVLGIVGLLLPVVPTVPFLLVAAACYARASERFYRLLLNNRYVGPPLREWRRHRSIPWRTKLIAIVLLSITLTASIVLFVRPPIAKLLLAIIGITVGIYLYRIPSRDRPRQ